MQEKEEKYISLPSSKTCSCCGYIKDDLNLKDRIFECPKYNKQGINIPALRRGNLSKR